MQSLRERAAQLYMIYSCNMNGTHKSFSECISLAKEGYDVESIKFRIKSEENRRKQADQTKTTYLKVS